MAGIEINIERDGQYQWRSQRGYCDHGLSLNFQNCDLKKVKFDQDMQHTLCSYSSLCSYAGFVCARHPTC